MGKIAVVYWTGTGNTEMMANAVVEGAVAKGADVDLFEASEFSNELLESYDALALGCPSMGAENLEEMSSNQCMTPSRTISETGKSSSSAHMAGEMASG